MLIVSLFGWLLQRLEQHLELGAARHKTSTRWCSIARQPDTHFQRRPSAKK
ncbi:hypothetical protein ACVBEG_27105 [Pseudomonas sp. GG8]